MRHKYPIENRAQLKPCRLWTLFLFVLPLVLILHGCYHNPHISSGEANSVERRVNEFIGGGPEFLGSTMVLSKDEVINKFGNPLNLTSRKVKNRHADDEVWDTIYELFYEGVYFEIYEVTLFERSYVYHIILANKKYQPKWRLGIGATREYVTTTLGRPNKIQRDSWTYVSSDGYPNSVIFNFEKDRVQKIEWLYIVD